jgi:hypothetical protein
VTAADGAGEFVPAFPGQRPPFERGNTAAVVHGAFSERVTRPVAEQIAADLLADKDTPDHLREPLFEAAVMGWAQAEAVCRQLRAFVAGQSIEDAMTELSSEEEDEDRERGSARRRSSAKRTASALSFLVRWEAHAAMLRGKLGLDPASAARVGKDIAARRYLDAATPLDTALEQITANRRKALGIAGREGG